MKYNPKVHEDVAIMPGFAHIHPYQPEKSVQGALQVQYELQNMLAQISGMNTVSLRPRRAPRASSREY